MLLEGSYAANGVKHCVRPADMAGKVGRPGPVTACARVCALVSVRLDDAETLRGPLKWLTAGLAWLAGQADSPMGCNAFNNPAAKCDGTRPQSPTAVDRPQV